MLNQTTIEEVMSNVMKDTDNGLINEDTMFMIETILNNGTMEELMTLTEGYYWNTLKSYIDNVTFVLVEWERENEGLTLTKVRLSYLNDWAEMEGYPQYRVLKTL